MLWYASFTMPMETHISQDPENIRSMGVQEAKDFMVQYITSLKITEKHYAELGENLAKWTSRIALARSRGALDLAKEAEKEVERITLKHTELEREITALKAHIETLRQQLPALAAQDRTIDPDMLEQELLIATGRLPGEQAEAEGALQNLEKDTAATAALNALKAKMNRG
jgi:phage shock protein A